MDLDPAERASASMNKEGVEHKRSCCGALEVAAEFETAAWKLARLLRRSCGAVALAGERGARVARRREELHTASYKRRQEGCGSFSWPTGTGSQ
jgi:hypothetical protein